MKKRTYDIYREDGLIVARDSEVVKMSTNQLTVVTPSLNESRASTFSSYYIMKGKKKIELGKVSHLDFNIVAKKMTMHFSKPLPWWFPLLVR